MSPSGAVSLGECLVILTAGIAWVNETPPNYDEPRVKILAGFPRDRDLPKPVALILPPLTVASPLLIEFFFSDRVDADFLWLLGFLFVVAGFIIMHWIEFFFSDRVDADFLRLLGFLFVIAGFVIMHWIEFFFSDRVDADFLRLLGFLFVFAGFIIMHWVQAHMGRFYTFDRSMKKAHTLVKTGPYSYVRHPGYLSFALTVVGVLIASHFSLVNILPITTFAMVMKGIPSEEKMLTEAFGEEYTRFCATRARVIPGIL